MEYFRKRATNIIADPVHKYIEFTVPRRAGEKTEKDLIDNEWLQRLKWIHQLQCAMWVFPGGEHSRFTHSLGSMHIASTFAKQVYPSLKHTGHNVPSFEQIEETLRLAALLHDIGHGPFGHFFDHNYLLRKYSITHEDIGQKIITTRLNKIIEDISRSPSGEFKEKIKPEHIAFLIKKPSPGDTAKKYPKWLHSLRCLFSGLCTVDNLDYVMRDSLMCGISAEPIDLERIVYYSSMSENGLVLHKSGISALMKFLETKSFLYTNVYFHRTVRSFDLHLGEIFQRTLDKIFNANPLDQLDEYIHLTDLSLLGQVNEWIKRKVPRESEDKNLVLGWQMLLRRRKKWRFICGTTEEQHKAPRLQRLYTPAELQSRIQKGAKIPAEVTIRIDMAKYDNRPVSPFAEKGTRPLVYNPSDDSISDKTLGEHLNRFPFRTTLCFLFINTANDKYDGELVKAFERNVGQVEEEEPTNI